MVGLGRCGKDREGRGKEGVVRCTWLGDRWVRGVIYFTCVIRGRDCRFISTSLEQRHRIFISSLFSQVIQSYQKLHDLAS